MYLPALQASFICHFSQQPCKWGSYNYFHSTHEETEVVNFKRLAKVTKLTRQSWDLNPVQSGSKALGLATLPCHAVREQTPIYSLVLETRGGRWLTAAGKVEEGTYYFHRPETRYRRHWNAEPGFLQEVGESDRGARDMSSFLQEEWSDSL